MGSVSLTALLLPGAAAAAAAVRLGTGHGQTISALSPSHGAQAAPFPPHRGTFRDNAVVRRCQALKIQRRCQGLNLAEII